MFRMIQQMFRRRKAQASVSSDPVGPEPKNIQKRSNSTIRIVEMASEQRTFECGHSGPQWFVVDAYGTVSTKIHPTHRCPDCYIEDLRKCAVRCALCGHAILPGDGVALYHAGLNKLPYVEKANLIDDHTALGCIRWDCCPSAGFFGGNWSEKGFIPRFGGNTAISHCFISGKPVIVDDIA